ncbi:MAG TPA: alpha/beta fold hydrolase [Candidatus Saccharimonadales bacterium]|nr:alpha/beta fold hydrolase [Candidatus Saccharimonadales bacterium]
MSPDEYTIQETFVDVGDGHMLYVQDWGNPKIKIPFLSIHGGPGSGSKGRHKNGYDPAKQRVIFYDQRGSGKSLPAGSIDHNTTQDLIEDIEKIRKQLKIEQLVLTGASWGPCLALAYSLQYPKHVKAMVLSGIFTGSQDEIDWIHKGRFRDFFPDVWQKFLDETPKAHHADPSGYHLKNALGDDDAAAKRSLYALDNLESGVMSLDDRHTPENYDEYETLRSKIENYYLANRCFLPDGFIMDNAHKLTMPIWLVQGRYDFVCRPKIAYDLHQKLPNSHLIWTISGHSADHENWNLLRTIRLQLTEVSG